MTESIQEKKLCKQIEFIHAEAFIKFHHSNLHTYDCLCQLDFAYKENRPVCKIIIHSCITLMFTTRKSHYHFKYWIIYLKIVFVFEYILPNCCSWKFNLMHNYYRGYLIIKNLIKSTTVITIWTLNSLQRF